MEKMLTLSPKEFSKLLAKNPGQPAAQKTDMDTEAFYYQHVSLTLHRRKPPALTIFRTGQQADDAVSTRLL